MALATNERVGIIGMVTKAITKTVTVLANRKIQFRDTGLFIQSDADGSLKLSSDGIFKQVGGSQSLSGAGAVDIVNDLTLWTTTGANAGTLADGAEGQRKHIICPTYVGDGTLTPSNLGNGSTITFGAAGTNAELIFLSSAWYMIGGSATLA